MELKGTYTAMITPFKEEKLDEEGFVYNLHMQLEAGVNGVVVLGTTGEAPTLTKEEQKRVISIAVRELKNKIPVIVGTGTYSTQQTIEDTKQAKDLGADAALIVAPYYNRPTQEGLYLHFEAISKAVDVPIIVYNIPKRCGVNIEVNTLKRISQLKNVIGLKDDIQQLSDTIQNTHLQVVSVDDVWTMPMIALGAKGVISVISNLFPKLVIEMVDAALRGDLFHARTMHYELLPLFQAAFIETNPCPINAMMQIAHLPSGGVRLPLTPVSAINRKYLEELVKKYENKSGYSWLNRHVGANVCASSSGASTI